MLRLGRSDFNELVLSEWHVSGEHASIVLAGASYVVRDHNSTNGTRIERGGDTIDLADDDAREGELRDGDLLLLGDRERPVRIKVTIGDEPDDARIVSLRKVDELAEVEATVGADRQVLQSLYESQKRIGSAIDLDDVIDVVAEQVFRFLPRATHVTVALREVDARRKKNKSARYVPVGTRVRGGADSETIPITRSVFKKVVAERAAVLAADAKRDVGETASIMGAQIESTIGVPLWHGDEEIIGVLQVDNRDASGVFRERDLDILALLSQSASQAFAHARLVNRLRAAEESQRNENVYLKRREQGRRFDGIIGEAAGMKKLFEQLRKVVDTRVTVLVEGETGTGKELIASAVHYWSERRDALFIAQNCAAMPENLLESELFGHKKGSFTGATDDKKGLFELADGGTLFLDEVGEMPLNLQAKLLRVLQEGEIRPIGHNQTKRVDTRIVAATNRDLEKEVAEGRFREDLYYRLKVFPITVPPLRERREDIPLLAGHFLKKYANEFGRTVRGFSQQAMELLASYKWPGNVRELENEVQRLIIQMDDGGFVEPEHVSPRIRQVENVIDKVAPKKGTLKEMMEQVEKWILLEALKEHDNNKSQTARTLGITREGLHKKLKNFGL
ncbi:MAG: FHA domain-containing protein [Sandaracinaceae bacterium]|nr:MAG: FHA domain-containing protein [Sandaracinaceae bacterium]HBQ11831.1 sigma-54-dependent Fis family transcriptional regulator [Myxococcales bacterium]